MNATLYTKFKEKNQFGNQLSAVDTMAQFDFGNCLISLDTLNKEDISAFQKVDVTQQKIDIDAFKILSKVLTLAVHEYTHFVDATSTVWGAGHLSTMNKAYLSDCERGMDENSFHESKLFHNHLKS